MHQYHLLKSLITEKATSPNNSKINKQAKYMAYRKICPIFKKRIKYLKDIR